MAEARSRLGAEFVVVREDLAQLRGLVNDAIAKLGNGFQGLAAKIKEQDLLIQAMSAQASGGSTGKEGFRAFATETGEVLGELGQRIQRTSQNSMTMARQIEEVSTRIDEVGKLVNGVKQIASHTKLLALNAMIEAAHAGESGRGFAVVANEVKALSQSSDTFSDQIVNAVEHVRTNMAQARGAMSGIAEADTEFAQIARNRVHTMLEEVGNVNTKMALQLQEAANVSRGIMDSVSLSVTALQFDDMVNQLIQHIDTRLQRLEPFASEIVSGTPQRLVSAINEHQAQVLELQHKSVAQISMENGDVELF